MPTASTPTPHAASAQKPRIPVSILTGFLGSGKTTALNHLVQQPQLRRTLVIINEFGEIGLDHRLIAHSTDDVVVEMSSGCLCCTIRGDLAKTLRDAPGRYARDGVRWFDRVVIETTGLADPAPVLHTILADPFVSQRYDLDAVLTTVDAVHGVVTLDRQAESVKQVAVADRLLLTKTDLADPQGLKALQTRLRVLNPAAPQVLADRGRVDAALLFDAGLYEPQRKSPQVQQWLRTEAYPHRHHGPGTDAASPTVGGIEHAHTHNDVNRHDAEIRALCLMLDEPIPAPALNAWLNLLLELRGEDLLRIKGIVNVADQPRPVVIHGVQHLLSPPIELDEWPDDDRRSRIVFITRSIDESVLQDTLKVFTDAITRLPVEQTLVRTT